MKNLLELDLIGEEAKKSLGIREADSYNFRINVAVGDCGFEKGARNVVKTALVELEQNQLFDVALVQTDCMGMCNYEPTVEVIDIDGKKTLYLNVDEGKIKEIITAHIIENKIIKEYTKP